MIAAMEALRSAFPDWLWNLIVAVVKPTLILAFIGLNALLLIWGERKVAARIQRRRGPEVVGGPWGVLQSLADGVKLFAKEDVMPAQADRWMWSLAPSVVFVPAAMVFLVLPFGALGPSGPVLVMRDLENAVLYLLAVASFTVLGIWMAGWGSNNKYSLLGAMRAISMLISYEVPLVLAVLGVVLAAGSLSLVDIVEAQASRWFIIPQFLGFLVFYAATLAELNRTPFDLVLGESEIVVGYTTEYSGIRWSMFFFAEYGALVASSLVAANLFLGGWHGPFYPGVHWVLVKTYALVFLAIWIRWTLPRFRIDQVMDFGWKVLLPLSLLNLTATGAWMAVKA